MRYALATIVLAWITLVAASCGPAVQPAHGQGTAYPCGIQGVVCDKGSGGGCCDTQQICGHDLYQDPTGTCPVEICCDVGPDPEVSPPDIGARRHQHPRRHPERVTDAGAE